MPDQMRRQTGKSGRKIGRGLKKPSHMRYAAQNRRLKHKRRNVLKSSHGKWTYEKLLEHQKKGRSSSP